MTPDWLNDIVRAFGRQMGLERFELNERNAAGVRFENGLSFRLEYAHESLVMLAGFAALPQGDVLKRVLMSVHPDMRQQPPLRAGYLSRTGEVVFMVRLYERDVTVTALETVFRQLWNVVDQVRRAVA